MGNYTTVKIGNSRVPIGNVTVHHGKAAIPVRPLAELHVRLSKTVVRAFLIICVQIAVNKLICASIGHS